MKPFDQPPAIRSRSSSTDSGPDRRHKPRLTRLLHAIGIDVSYHRALGDHLYYRDEFDHEVEVLDMTGGYGSLLLGHNHPALIAEAQRLLASGVPIHAQGSMRGYAEKLAENLSRRAGDDYCAVFGNSGSEAVEAAIKHAMLETRGDTFIALEGAFHGKTLGALQLTSNAEYRQPFETGITVNRVRPNDMEQLESVFDQTNNLAGFIFEPILGEGGIHMIDPRFARRAAQLCAMRGIPLIADECQTGLGRTGAFLASHTLDVMPDYVILSKALSGGLAKISATLIRRDRYREDFDLKHSSTYAADDYSSAIALKALEHIDSATKLCATKGSRLIAAMNDLQRQFPDIIADVRGRGLMVGVQFQRMDHSSSFTLRYLSSQNELAYAVIGYLFNQHRIRIAPTMSDPWTLRIEPSAFIADTDLDQFVEALRRTCELLRDDDGPSLTMSDLKQNDIAQGLARTDAKSFAYDEPRVTAHVRSDKTKSTVGWLCHMIDADDLVSLEPSFDQLPFDCRSAYLDRVAALASPVVMSSVNIESIDGSSVNLNPILLPVTSRWMKSCIDARRFDVVRDLVNSGLATARSLGCDIVSLGQYTSIGTLNGTMLPRDDMLLTSGNSYAIALAIQAVRQAEQQRGIHPADSVLAIAGAAGNIGRTCAAILAPHYRQVILAGSEKSCSLPRLNRLARSIPNAGVTTDIGELNKAHTVVAAMNAVDAPLGSDHFRCGAIVCDVSVPPSVSPDTAAARPDLMVIKGGIVRLPFEEDIEFVGFPLSKGLTYGCMAEGILLGLDGIRDGRFTGSLKPQQVLRVEKMAQHHGFELADYKTSCVLDSFPRELINANACV